MLRLYTSLTILSLLIIPLFGQKQSDSNIDKCGIPDENFKTTLELFGDKWGYGYDSLLADIAIWDLNENVNIDVIGQSVLDREIFELTITDFSISPINKHRIYIHARTHPGEIQSFRVTDEIIRLVLSSTNIGTYLRGNCIFHVVPMINPDGVELEYPRENANNIDIESNWNKATPEIEVINLKNRFSALMEESNPIEIALNMHSAYACKRYFVYHHENGTSLDYAVEEKRFIGSIRDHYIEGIEPWTYYVSWENGTPNQYPESWWWNNFGEQVMALTYEDMNCGSAGYYDKTAFATLNGISDFLELGYVNFLNEYPIIQLKVKAYPNPFTDEVQIEWNNFLNPDRISIYDLSGRLVRTFSTEEVYNGVLNWNGSDSKGNEVCAGLYTVQIIQNNEMKTILLLKQ